MRKNLFLILGIAFLMSCTAEKPLYSWEKYETTSYNYLKNNDEKTLLALIESYQTIIEKQKGTRKEVPPGIYADYGFILLQAKKVKEGKEMLAMEVAHYPESKIFIDKILKMIEE
jgi:hypothetical protein